MQFSRAMRPIATLSIAALLGMSITSAADAASSLNPLAGNGGFTLTAVTDIELGSAHELEGSLAAGGDVISSTGSGDQFYSLVHSSAGSAGYSLPELDGSAVRLVAGGTFDRDASTGSIRVAGNGSTTSTQGEIRLGSADGLSVEARGAGVCVQAEGSSDCSPQSKVLEQSRNTQSVASVVDASAYETLVGDSGESALASVSNLIESGQIKDAVTVEWPADTSQPMNGITLDLAEGHVNLLTIDASDLPDTDWKLAFGDVVPSASTPLLITITASAGDTLILPTETIGMYAQGSQNNLYAPFMLWNIVTPAKAAVSVTSSGIVPGSVLAPDADLTIGPGKTLIEGQIHAWALHVRNDGELHHYDFVPPLTPGEPEDPEPAPEPSVTPDPEPSESPDPEPSEKPSVTPEPSATPDPYPEPSEQPSSDEPSPEPSTPGTSSGELDHSVTADQNAAGASQGSTASSLPRTGADVTWPLTLAGGLVVAGAGAFAIDYAARRHGK